MHNDDPQRPASAARSPSPSLGASSLRRWARAARHLPDRLLHPLRRRRARARLRAGEVPASVLVVCHGNICRSPFAAQLLQARLPEPLRGQVRIDSAGFLGPARPAPEHAVAVAARHGIDLAAHRSRGLSREIVASAELVLVMDTEQQRAIREIYGREPRDVLLLGDLDPRPIATRAIPDPILQPIEAFEASYGRIERCIAELAEALDRPSPPRSSNPAEHARPRAGHA
jgi:protein-tyrosine phosphatase